MPPSSVARINSDYSSGRRCTFESAKPQLFICQTWYILILIMARSVLAVFQLNFPTETFIIDMESVATIASTYFALPFTVLEHLPGAADAVIVHEAPLPLDCQFEHLIRRQSDFNKIHLHTRIRASFRGAWARTENEIKSKKLSQVFCKMRH